MQAALRNLYSRIFRLAPPSRGEIVLVQGCIFILPTRAGLVFGIVLLLMLLGSINYALSLGFILTFLLAALAISAILHTFRNLAGLCIAALRTPSIFAGDIAQFRICVTNPTHAERHSLALTHDKREGALIDVPAKSSAVASISVPAPRRGVLRAGPFLLFSRFPVGLFRAWARIDLDIRCIVYPRPAESGLPLPAMRAHFEGARQPRESDDFAGLRPYHPGDSPRHVAWKAAARGHGLLTKQFVAPANGGLWLDLDSVPPELSLEDKLSQLARWILDAHSVGLPYVFELPGGTRHVGTGETHRDRCLEALALFDPQGLGVDPTSGVGRRR